jgi:hypothetical protein
MRREPPDPKPEHETPAPTKPTEEQRPQPPRRFGIDDNPTDKKTDPWGGGPPPG